MRLILWMRANLKEIWWFSQGHKINVFFWHSLPHYWWGVKAAILSPKPVSHLGVQTPSNPEPSNWGMRMDLDVEPSKEAISRLRPHGALQSSLTCQQCQVVHKLSQKPSGFNQSYSLITLRTWLRAPAQSIYLALIRLEKQGYSIHQLIKSRDQYSTWQSLTLLSLCKMTSNELVLEGAQNNTLWPNKGETRTFIPLPTGEERESASMYVPFL